MVKVRPDRRWCWFVLHGQNSPCLVVEGEWGFTPFKQTAWGTSYGTALALAAALNMAMGLTPTEVDRIIGSSMKAHQCQNKCGRSVDPQEWKAGYRVCEHCEVRP